MFASKVRAPRDGAELLRCATVFRGNHSVMDGALKTMDGLALIKQVKNFRAEYWVAEIVTEIKGAEQLAQRVTGFVDGIAGGGGAEAVECLRRRVPAVLDRSTEPKKSVPAPTDGATGHSFGNDRLQYLRNVESLW
jgi:hypothetical protein